MQWYKHSKIPHVSTVGKVTFSGIVLELILMLVGVSAVPAFSGLSPEDTLPIALTALGALLNIIGFAGFTVCFLTGTILEER